MWETKKIKKTHAKEKNHPHKTIFTWFDNFSMSTELQGFHYYQRRIQSTTCDYNISLILKNTAMAWAYRPKPPLHGLNLSKSPIINHAILFWSSWVVKPDQTKLGFIKPNNRLIYESHGVFFGLRLAMQDSTKLGNSRLQGYHIFGHMPW